MRLLSSISSITKQILGNMDNLSKMCGIVYLAVVVFDLNAAALCRDDPGPDGHVELPPRHRLDPYVVPLSQQRNNIYKIIVK